METTKYLGGLLHRIVTKNILGFCKNKNNTSEIVQNSSNPYEFKLSPSFLAQTNPLTIKQLTLIENEIDRVYQIYELCDPRWDADVIANLDSYSEAIINRLQSEDLNRNCFCLKLV